MITLTREQADDLVSEEGLDFEDGSSLELIEFKEWVQYYKDQHSSGIYKHSSGKFYSLGVSRCGSHWDGYEVIPDQKMYEVERVPVFVYEWRKV